MTDPQIIELYFARDQQAVSETAAKYGAFLLRLSRNILRSPDDAEECVNDTYLRTWNAIPPTRPAAFQVFLSRITRNLSLDRWERNRAAKRGGGAEVLLGELAECIPAPGGVERRLEEQEIAGLLSAFLRTLTPEARWTFLRRYWYGESLAEIAAGLGCGQGRVKSSLFRTRTRLRAYLEKEGIAL